MPSFLVLLVAAVVVIEYINEKPSLDPPSRKSQLPSKTFQFHPPHPNNPHPKAERDKQGTGANLPTIRNSTHALSRRKVQREGGQRVKNSETPYPQSKYRAVPCSDLEA